MWEYNSQNITVVDPLKNICKKYYSICQSEKDISQVQAGTLLELPGKKTQSQLVG